MRNQKLIAAVAAMKVKPIVITGEIARQFAIFGVLSGVNPQRAAEFLLGRSADQLLDPDDSFGCDMADLFEEQALADYLPTLNRPSGTGAWSAMLEDLAAA